MTIAGLYVGPYVDWRAGMVGARFHPGQSGWSILKSWVGKNMKEHLGVCQARLVDGCGDESLVGGEWRLTGVAGDRYNGHTGIKRQIIMVMGWGGKVMLANTWARQQFERNERHRNNNNNG